jgi:hypothetical protein
MMQLVRDLPEPDGYFLALAAQPPMVQALWSTACELRMATPATRCGSSAGKVIPAEDLG